MKKSGFAICVMILCFLGASFSEAQNVVVIPLNSAKKLKNIVTVTAKGGDFTDPGAAVNSITDAGANNPYLVLIGPGVYTLTETVIMKPYVSIAGSGRGITTLTGGMSSDAIDSPSSAVISCADNTSLSNLSVINTGGAATYARAILNDGKSPSIHDLTASSSGTDYSAGIYNHFNAAPRITDSHFSSSANISANGIWNNLATVELVNVTAVSTGASGYGVADFNGSDTIIRRSTLEGGTAGLYTASSSTTYVSQSTVIGGVQSLGTTLCVASDDGAGAALTCP